MAVKIRLKRLGKIRAPYYRIVVADSRTKRDGKSIEEIGKYHPKDDPSFIEVKSERVQYWLSVGAQPSEPVRAILKKTGDWQQFKGEPAPAPLLQPKTKTDKRAAYDEALKGAYKEPAADSGSKKARKKADAPSEEPAASDAPAAGDSAANTAAGAETSESAKS